MHRTVAICKCPMFFHHLKLALEERLGDAYTDLLFHHVKEKGFLFALSEESCDEEFRLVFEPEVLVAILLGM